MTNYKEINTKAIIVTMFIMVAAAITLISKQAPNTLLCFLSTPAIAVYLIGAKKWGWLWLWEKSK